MEEIMKLKNFLQFLSIGFLSILGVSKADAMERYPRINDNDSHARQNAPALQSQIKQGPLLLKNPEIIFEQKTADNDLIKVQADYSTFATDITKEQILSLEINLYKNNEKLGYAEAVYHSADKKGSILRIHILKNRNQGIGSLLLGCTLKKLIELNCTYIKLEAYPFDLAKDQDFSQMVPKLINFYKQFGAEPDYDYEGCRYLSFTNIPKTQNAINKLLEKWELKDLNASASSNNTHALKRAQIIMGHLAPAELSAQPTHGITDNLEKIVYKEKIYSNQTKELIGSIEIERTTPNVYHAQLFDAHNREIGDATFLFDKHTKGARIELIDINHTMRGKGYGKLLLAHIGKFLISKGCKYVSGIANPFGLSEDKNQSAENMLPGLIGFYQQFGASVTKQNDTKAKMQSGDVEHAIEQINKILSKI
jgi:GNAT superfamily N-acetyltransferase